MYRKVRPDHWMTCARLRRSGGLQCQEALRLLPPASWLTLSDVEEQLLFNTRVPHGTSLPRKAACASGALVLAEDLAHHAALALDNARLYQDARAAQAALPEPANVER